MNKNIYKFSVIIPSRNRRDTLSQVMSALEAQTFPKSLFEVIVIDDFSTDDTAAFLSTFRQETDLHITILHGTGASAGAARNLGLEKAQGERILFLDADTIPQKDLILQHKIWYDFFGDDACVLGYVSMSDKLKKRQQGRCNDTKTKYDGRQISELFWPDYRTANTSLSLEKCRQVGGFDPHMPAAEDSEFASRLQKIGVRFFFIRDIHVVHHHPLSFAGYFQKGQLYGRAVAYWYAKAPEFRTHITSRYGVYAPELHVTRKVKHLVRRLFVNSLTVPLLFWCGRFCRSVWFDVSDRLYKCVFRYHVRQSFRSSLKNVQLLEHK